MDYISQKILEVFQENSPDNKVYVAGIKEELKENKTKYDGMMYLYKLDRNNLASLAEKFEDVSLNDLQQLKKILAKL